ncbi:hypothetical protein DMB66_00915 [Actinoplanes sp. ATCC 53533]|uniref:hypothetical protein n=1 Tax=Actinoplanes sp. ATCC 53533 TaxID=1288362 RepID=UPI000F77DAD4|nr:hypothetical protein [Actinoplanes sp. ATCC 53533]RSM74680.1 hypothetical protein DMB66_00915 [Actinoplanes sp. ATCC 53533]
MPRHFREALALWRGEPLAARRRPAGEIGVEPGAGLRDIHRAILRGEVDQAPSVASPPRHRPPAQLPLDIDRGPYRRQHPR